MCLASPFARAGDGLERHQARLDAQDDIGPRMPDDTPWAMLALLGVFRMHTGALWDGALHQQGHLPGQRMLGHVVARRGPWGRLLLGAVLSRRDRDCGVGLQKLTAWGCVPSRKTCGCFESMFPGHDHQTKERTDANRCETCADRETTSAPGVHGVSLPDASPLSLLSGGGRRGLDRHQGAVSTSP